MADNALKHKTRDQLVSMVAAGANPDLKNIDGSMTDRAFVVEARRKGDRYDWDEASFWNAVHAAEQYLRTYDNAKAEKAAAQKKYDDELNASRAAFTEALNPETSSSGTDGPVKVKSTAPVKPAGVPRKNYSFSPAVAVGIVAAAFVVIKFLPGGNTDV
jgi:hypothetical protein